ncbi:MAG: HPr family phosphocarrier protein, partial [Clostridia bacterium]|nr:HPr family phosphocarrier protein [Clostridia bacterium]
LGITRGTSVTLVADGNDEDEALESLMSLISSDFADIQ